MFSLAEENDNRKDEILSFYCAEFLPRYAALTDRQTDRQTVSVKC